MYPEIRMKELKQILSFLRTQPYSPQTVDNYRRHLERLHRFLLARELDIGDLTQEDFIDFLEEQNWGQNFRRQSLYAAKAFLRHYYGPDHPVMSMSIPRTRSRTLRTLNSEEIKKVLDSLDLDKITGVRNYAIICLMVDTGLRASEVCRLKILDLSTEKGTLQVRIKGGDFATALFSRYTAAYLEDWLTLRLDYVKTGVQEVFIGVRGSTAGYKMTRSGLKSNFRRIARNAGVEHFSPHALRRAMATIMIGEQNVSTRIVQMAGRWKDSRQVEHYSRALSVERVRPHLTMQHIIDAAGVSDYE